MAESSGRIVSGESFSPEQVPSSGVVSKVRRNVASKSADRIKNRLSKSPKRRAGTPEPERRIYTDDSEKDISDENVQKSGESSREVEDEGRGKQNSGIRRFFSRSKGKRDLGRSRSLERSVPKEPESEDDFEEIRRMHKSKEIEEEMKEVEKHISDSKPKIEELKEFVPKDMPPLIVAPKDMKKRKRHKSLPLQESQSEEEKPKTPLTKTKTRLNKRKPSTSEEEDLARSRRGSSNTRSEDEMSELRNRRLGIRKTLRKEKDTSESEREPEKETKMEDVKESAKNKEEGKQVAETKPWFFRRWFSKKPEKDKKPETKETKEKERPPKEEEKPKEKLKESWFVTQTFREWRAHVNEHRHYYESCLRLKNRCVTDLIILLMFCGFGGFVFRFTEGAFESFYKCGVKRVKRDFIDTLWKSSQYMLEEDWKSQARRKLMDFEDQLHSAHEAGMTTYSGMKSWSFLNAVVYCLSVVTTIGYGHISPSTTTGRAITIIYAIFGIPMFLILLADFGKLFTRGIKFVWAFVRRLYYTGSCRRVRKTAPVQEMMKGVQIMYDFAKSRRLTSAGLQQDHLKPPEANMQGIPETPSTPNWSAYEIDDEFNLPISVAISILLAYIFFGATLYWMWEEWTFFESFYFVFISMSTIGFGDFVPQHPMYMMLSIVYLIFGLALTSMCINVVQEKLSDTFRQASVKLGTTIGLTVVEDGGICPPEGLDIKQVNQQIS